MACYVPYPADPSQLVLLSLRSNLLEGPAQALEGCGNLVQLDIRENAFTGALPASTDWRLLTTYQVANNNFTGTALRLDDHQWRGAVQLLFLGSCRQGLLPLCHVAMLLCCCLRTPCFDKHS